MFHVFIVETTKSQKRSYEEEEEAEAAELTATGSSRKKKKKRKHKKRDSSPEVSNSHKYVDVDALYTVSMKLKSKEIAKGMLLLKLPVVCPLAELRKLIRKDYLSGIRAVKTLPLYEVDVTVNAGDREYQAVSEVAWQSILPLVLQAKAKISLHIYGISLNKLDVKCRRHRQKTGSKLQTVQKQELERALKTSTPYVRTPEQESEREHMRKGEEIEQEPVGVLVIVLIAIWIGIHVC